MHKQTLRATHHIHRSPLEPFRPIPARRVSPLTPSQPSTRLELLDHDRIDPPFASDTQSCTRFPTHFAQELITDIPGILSWFDRWRGRGFSSGFGQVVLPLETCGRNLGG